MRQQLVTPTRYLAFVNVIGTALGFVQGIISARLLGAEAFGVIAIIAATNTTVLNFLDVRLVDLAGKLYYRSRADTADDLRAYRASVLQTCLVGNGLISFGLTIVGLLANIAFVGVFTATPVRLGWLVAQSLVLAMSNWANTFDYLQRFSGRFYLMGTWRLINRILYVIVFLSMLLASPNLDGYYSGALAATVLSLAMTAGLSIFIWLKYDRLPLLRKGVWQALADYRRDSRFLFFGNLLGYVKMLHRGSDVLIVGLFANDRITGLYRLARSLTDGFYVLFDAMNQVYGPRFMELLSQRAHVEYRRLARRVLGYSAGFTLLALVAEIVAMPLLMRTILANRFVGAESAIAVMTIPFVFVTGIHMWVWPMYVYSGRIARYTVYGLLACLAQYVVMIGLFLSWRVTPVAAALGYLAHYLVLVPLAYRLLARGDRADCMPGTRHKVVTA